MKRFIKQKLSKTSKNSIERIYLDDKHIKDSGFEIGGTFSYDVDLEKHQVRIVPNPSLEGKGKVSRRKNRGVLVPLIDVRNKKIEQAFSGINQCRITIFEGEVLIEGVLSDSNVTADVDPQSTTDKPLTFTQLCKSVTSKVISFAQKKREKQLKARVKQETLAQILAKKSSKVADGQLSLFEDFTLSTDEVTQTLAQTEQFQQDLPLLNQTLKVLSLFSGIGAFEEALSNLGVPFELVNYCEWKPEIAKAYSLMHKVPISKNLGDITQVDENKLPDFDLMTVGFPCQDLSSLGNQKGFFNEDGSLTRSGLFYEAMRIAKAKKPRFIILENVKGLLFKKMKPFFEDVLALLKVLGYNVRHQLMNSKDYNVPHSRSRVFFVAIRSDVDNHQFQFPEPEPLTVKARDWYDDLVDVPEEVYVGPQHHKYFNEMRLKKKYSSLNADVLVCFNTKMGGLSNPQNFIKDERGYRILTAREMFRFQGFKSSHADLLQQAGYKLSQIGYMLGNSITVNVIQKIFEQLFRSTYQFQLVK